MIHSASTSLSAARSDAIAAALNPSASRVSGNASDRIHIDMPVALRASLQQVPEIRPEVVERARALAADPAYPSAEVIGKISAAIVNSPDLSEEPS